MKYVIKRSGQKTPFQEKKLYSAIARASEEAREADEPFLDEEGIEEIVQDVLFEIRDKEEIGVEEIQNAIEEILMDKLPNLARRYIRYRYKREIARKGSTAFMDAIVEKIEGRKIDNSNANLDEASFGGRTGEATSVMMKEYALNHCMSEMSRKNHLNNEIYIHDLNSYAVGMHNCLSLPLDDLLAKGFKTRQVDIRPAGSINTAFQLVAVLFQLQSLMQFGGVSATHLDWTMVPYVRKSFNKHWIDGMNYVEGWENFKESAYYKEHFPDKNTIVKISIEDAEAYDILHFQQAYQYAKDMTEREMKQAVEGMIHNLNSLQSRSGN